MPKSIQILGQVKIAVLVCLLLVTVPVLFSQDTRIGTNNSGQVVAGNICRGSIKDSVYFFTLRYIPAGTSNLLAINNFTTSGTYVASDITQIQLWTCPFQGCASTVLRGTINTGLGPGLHSFTSLNVPITQGAGFGAGIYFMISVDVSPSAVVGHTFSVDLITASMLQMSIGTTGNEATNNPPGTQTICSPLPIELISFTGKYDGKNNILEWSTASEITNDYFTLEKSSNGIQFMEYKRMAGAGNSNVLLRYSLVDENTSAGITYYRLKQTDYNGNYTYSDIVSVKADLPDDYINIYPNPVNNTFEIQHAANISEIIITDRVGKTLKQIDIHQPTKDISDLPAGLYFLVIRSQDKSFVKQIIKN